MLGVTSLFLLVGIGLLGQGTSRAGDTLMRRFISFSDSVTVHFIARGIESNELGERKAQASCTGVRLGVRSGYIFGLTAQHCIEPEASFKPETFSIEGKAAKVFKTERFDIALWEIEDSEASASVEVPLTGSWEAGDRVFVACVRRYQNSYKREYSTGYTLSGSGDYALGTLSQKPVGDVVHTAPVIYGCSGGGVFVYNETLGRFELLAITTAFSVFGAYSFASSVGTIIPQALKDNKDTDERAKFSNWDTLSGEEQEEWLRIWQKNERYRLRLGDDGEFSLEVGARRYSIGPFAVILNDWREERIRLSGRVRDVDWRRYSAIKK